MHVRVRLHRCGSGERAAYRRAAARTAHSRRRTAKAGLSPSFLRISPSPRKEPRAQHPHTAYHKREGSAPPQPPTSTRPSAPPTPAAPHTATQHRRLRQPHHAPATQRNTTTHITRTSAPQGLRRPHWWCTQGKKKKSTERKQKKGRHRAHRHRTTRVKTQQRRRKERRSKKKNNLRSMHHSFDGHLLRASVYFLVCFFFFDFMLLV